jgi:hypothetical protein
MMEQPTRPTETISLPSKGLLYPKDSALAAGIVDMGYMRAVEEDILTNSNYLKNGTAIDKLLQSMIVTKINYDDLLVGDKDAILIGARILGYGKEYDFQYYSNGRLKQGKVDLTTLEEKELDQALVTSGINEFNFKCPASSNEVTFKLLTHGDEKKIDDELKGLRKINPNASPEITTRLKHMITSINGERNKEKIRLFVDKDLLAQDSRELRKYYSKISPGIKLEFHPEDSEEAVNIPIGASFFWPDSGI